MAETRRRRRHCQALLSTENSNEVVRCNIPLATKLAHFRAECDGFAHLLPKQVLCCDEKERRKEAQNQSGEVLVGGYGQKSMLFTVEETLF